ncbi:hypothetical protein EUGRSUZ_L01302 [Eucalyptus grandis]|uniref:Uncharacterized protein n=1 Tax=Eucalyptus grandis TaxID=71139 RepID=A0A058ZVM7_EUCGR|nr:hypothetical protein EUGRSUZ_L01302 [Eucalyptus grandis]
MAPEINHTKGHKGSQWFEVNLKLAINITEDSTYYSKKFCRPTFYVDEHYFPRMLTIQSPDLLANRSLTWVVDWSRGGPHSAQRNFSRTSRKTPHAVTMIKLIHFVSSLLGSLLLAL